MSLLCKSPVEIDGKGGNSHQIANSADSSLLLKKNCPRPVASGRCCLVKRASALGRTFYLMKTASWAFKLFRYFAQESHHSTQDASYFMACDWSLGGGKNLQTYMYVDNNRWPHAVPEGQIPAAA